MECVWKIGSFQSKKTRSIPSARRVQPAEVKYGWCHFHLLLLNIKSLYLFVNHVIIKTSKMYFYIYQIAIFFLILLNRKLLWVIPVISCLHVEEHVHTFSALWTGQWCGGDNSPFNCNRGQLVAYSPLNHMTKDQNNHHNNSPKEHFICSDCRISRDGGLYFV